MIIAITLLALVPVATPTKVSLETRDAHLQIDRRGWVTSLVSRRTGKEYIPVSRPSPLLSLHETGRPDGDLVAPESAVIETGGKLELRYRNGSVAKVRFQRKNRYFRFKLIGLTHREKIDDVVWGPINTAISKRIGDLIGVVRNDDWAIGMVGLDDNTIAGAPTPGDAYGMEYFVHSADPAAMPLPAGLKEGQRFNIGGDGVSDVAFYSHPEEYFQMVYGTGSWLEPRYGSCLAYHSRDRRISRSVVFSLLPHFPGSRPRHQQTDIVDADFIGSGIALYACPDRDCLRVIEQIEIAEHLPHVITDGKWIRDPSGIKTDIAWSGPHDKLIEYATALGLHAVQDEAQGEYYANPVDHWLGPRVGFSTGRKLSYLEYTRELGKHDIKYGLHTLCLFAQAGRNSDVTPAASPLLQTVLRTKLASNITPADTEIAVSDPSFLGEDGTWPMRDGSNAVRIGTELLKYSGISAGSPYTLKGVQRGQYGTVAQAHQAGSQLSKLQLNCYGGFVPDINGMLEYADYYAKVMAENGMQYIDFDGLESTLYQNQGYFGVRRFLRRFVETYGKVTNGKVPRIMGSCVFGGGWEYMSVCNVGGGANMFDPVRNRWGIEGKDVRNGLGNSYFPPTFGIQDFQPDWTVYDIQNLQAKAIGWDASYMLGLSQKAVESSGEKRELFKAFRTWEDARAAGVFTSAIKKRLRDLNLKFHLERFSNGELRLTPVQELRLSSHLVLNPYAPQPIHLALRMLESVDRLSVELPGGGRISCDREVKAGQFVIVNEGRAYIADKFRKQLASLPTASIGPMPAGSSTLNVSFPDHPAAAYELTVWLTEKPIILRLPLRSGSTNPEQRK